MKVVDSGLKVCVQLFSIDMIHMALLGHLLKSLRALRGDRGCHIISIHHLAHKEKNILVAWALPFLV
jgi:hypothetical protein